MTPLWGAAADGTAWFYLPEGRGRLQLWPQQAAFEPDLGLLLVADAHLGKAVSFRRLGVPVPEATTDEALTRLDALVAATGGLIAGLIASLIAGAVLTDGAQGVGDQRARPRAGLSRPLGTTACPAPQAASQGRWLHWRHACHADRRPH